MHRFTGALLFIALVLSATVLLPAQSRDRSKTPDKYKWNLADIYPSDDAWAKAREQFLAEIPGVEKFKGTLGKSADNLYACLDLEDRLTKDLYRLAAYASLYSDQDTRDSKRLGMKQNITQDGVKFGTASSYIEPEILKLDRATIDSFLAREKKLERFHHYLDDLLRRQAHTGTEGEEKIIADAGIMAGGPQEIYEVFSDADFPNPQVTLSDGKTVTLDKAGYTKYRAVPNREDRKRVFAAFFGRINDFRGTFGTELYANVRRDIFYMNARKYGSCLESALDANNIPVQVYHSLVDNANKNLATFHRYLMLRKRILGVDTLHYYDLYAPLLNNVRLAYTIQDAEKNILDALAPLGKEYTAAASRAFNERWVDVYPNPGKRSGAYSNGSAYDVHPYMLLNFNDDYEGMTTLAHELGHTMHSYLSNKNQPFATATYPIFVAEVASTFNEALLIDHMLKTIKDDSTRLSLLGNYLEGIKGTVFRQTQFAEFELRIHEMAEKGEALTGDKLNALYEQITKKYYGHDKGICIVDDEDKAEWAYIPHFYYNFYVFQYATSFTASAALSEQVLAGDKAETKRYLTFISSGSSDYPINLLKKAGVDMTTSQPFDLTMKKMNRVMDEMEQILKKMGK